MEALSEHSVACPYCGEAFAALIDASEGDACYIEDCPICCRPIRFDLHLDGAGETTVSIAREDDC